MVVESFASAQEGLQDVIQSWERGFESLRVLEVGCGSLNRVSFSRPTSVTVIDKSASALTAYDLPASKILGDVDEIGIGADLYDVIVAGGIIEYLKAPIPVLDKLADALRPGGIIVLGSTNPFSLQGMLKRFTPLFLQLPLHKYLLRTPQAGAPGQPPYPRRPNALFNPRSLQDWSEAADLALVYLADCENDYRHSMRQRSPMGGWIVDGIVGIGSRLFRYPLNATDFLAVTQKTPVASPRPASLLQTSHRLTEGA